MGIKNMLAALALIAALTLTSGALPATHAHAVPPDTPEEAAEPERHIPEAGEQGRWGTAPWFLAASGELLIGPGDLPSGNTVADQPWRAWAPHITKIVFSEPENTVLPKNAYGLLSDLNAVTTIDNAGDLDLSRVRDMKAMFAWMPALTTIDVAAWDTSDVIDMSGMFEGDSALTRLDVSGWNTQNVLFMHYMFAHASALSQLDVAHWDTGSVIDLSYMFAHVSVITALDVSNWDTRNVVFMDSVFDGASALTTLDLSSWDITPHSRQNMLAGTSSLQTLSLNTPTVFRPEMGLPDPPTTSDYTGRWELRTVSATEPLWNVNTGSPFAGDPGHRNVAQFTWQRTTLGNGVPSDPTVQAVGSAAGLAAGLAAEAGPMATATGAQSNRRIENPHPAEAITTTGVSGSGLATTGDKRSAATSLQTLATGALLSGAAVWVMRHRRNDEDFGAVKTT